MIRMLLIMSIITTVMIALMMAQVLLNSAALRPQQRQCVNTVQVP